MGRDNYMGFFVDWSIEVIATTTGYMTVILSALFYIGMYLYINGMVNDMRMELMPNRPDSFKKPRHPLDQRKNWSIYVRQIEFHIEIIGYQLTSRFALISFNQSNESIFLIFVLHFQRSEIIMHHNGSDPVQYNIDMYHCYCVQFVCN